MKYSNSTLEFPHFLHLTWLSVHFMQLNTLQVVLSKKIQKMFIFHNFKSSLKTRQKVDYDPDRKLGIVIGNRLCSVVFIGGSLGSPLRIRLARLAAPIFGYRRNKNKTIWQQQAQFKATNAVQSSSGSVSLLLAQKRKQ